MPAVKRLLDAARAAGARVIFSLGRAAEQKIVPELEGITTVVVVGTAANGAVLCTGFGANARGLTVVVPEDGISSRDPFATYAARYQLLNQPGFANATNQALAPKAATLSRSDLITFKKAG